MQLVHPLPQFIPLSKRPLSGHRTPEPASSIIYVPGLAENLLSLEALHLVEGWACENLRSMVEPVECKFVKNMSDALSVVIDSQFNVEALC